MLSSSTISVRFLFCYYAYYLSIPGLLIGFFWRWSAASHAALTLIHLVAVGLARTYPICRPWGGGTAEGGRAIPRTSNRDAHLSAPALFAGHDGLPCFRPCGLTPLDPFYGGFSGDHEFLLTTSCRELPVVIRVRFDTVASVIG